MNTFVAARQAIEARRDHICSDKCVRTSDGHCFVRIGLWRAQHEVVLRWNAPAESAVITDPGYL